MSKLDDREMKDESLIKVIIKTPQNNFNNISRN